MDIEKSRKMGDISGKKLLRIVGGMEMFEERWGGRLVFGFGVGGDW